MASGAGDVVWQPERRPWGWADGLALAVWTAALAAFFWDLVSFQRVLFYFDVSEINYPYRKFFADELKAGRFARWCPGLYCGHPLYSESQVGYLHPLKLLYPWLEAWQAFSLDTVLSVWLTGLGTYGWLRRHVGAAGSLAGAAVFGLSGFVWAHLIHTSMINALPSVPLAVWALESAWDGGRLRGVALGSIALAVQVFAGHLQDTILTAGLIVTYGLYRAATEHGRGGARPRAAALGMAGLTIVLGLALAAVQWVPSKELLDRSPRAGGLTWDELTYGSWHPELLPTLVVREAYGTRARDTDWMDGFYPYHEMNVYMGLTALGLAALGAAAYRDRWVGFWVLLTLVGGALMLGRFTVLFDFAHRLPVVGSSRIPVRFHLWVSLAVAALAAVGVDRLGRPGPVRLGGAGRLILLLVLTSLLIVLVVYWPAWSGSGRWRTPYQMTHNEWLGRELVAATIRTAVLAVLGGALARLAAGSANPGRRAWAAAALPLVIVADLLGAHTADVPTITPRYWTDPPPTAQRILADPSSQRLFGLAEQSSAPPGYASEPIDFLANRDPLDWSLAIAWGLRTARGETGFLPRRVIEFSDHVPAGSGRFAIQGVTHVVSSRSNVPLFGPPEPAGSAYIYRGTGARPRARLLGRPVYAAGEAEAMTALDRLGHEVVDRLVVEDPDRPLAAGSGPDPDPGRSGTARIVRDEPEHVVVTVDSRADAYLVLADTFDPGWSATLDGRSVPIRAAWVAFRAVFVPAGHHAVVFRYEPAGFRLGLATSVLGALVALGCLLWPRPVVALTDPHGDAGWPPAWPWVLIVAIGLTIAASAITVSPGPGLGVSKRWSNRSHQFTWGAGPQTVRSRPGALRSTTPR